ncbi:MAG: MFS transporter [Deltaproteobacteria bacterium]|nr:MFS transporter [Deltaproteobacteria bacterium]
MEGSKKKWLNSNVLFISLSAFFADLGYQVVLVIFPIFLVLDLHSSVIYFGIASAVSYGIGAFFGYFGGRAGDKFGHKKIAIIGNLLIPLLSFTGFSLYPAEAVAFFSTGWWARNFRSPSRRVLLSRSVLKEFYGKAFGFLHALDQGGGFFAGIYALILFTYHVPLKYILLTTIGPLLISTLFLTLISKKKLINNPDNSANGNINNNSKKNAAINTDDNNNANNSAGLNKKNSDLNENLFKRILIATSLYGFSSFSFGFPILTIAESSKNDALGILSYVLFFICTALTGLIAGKTIAKTINKLGFGYFLTFAGSLGMALIFTFSLNPLLYYICVAILGISLGIIETIEPTAISLIVKNETIGRGMGSLTAARSLGLFGGNVLMGLLYYVGANYSYLYAAILSLIASLIIFSSKSNL